MNAAHTFRSQPSDHPHLRVPLRSGARWSALLRVSCITAPESACLRAWKPRVLTEPSSAPPKPGSGRTGGGQPHFLQYGLPPPFPYWGQMLRPGRTGRDAGAGGAGGDPELAIAMLVSSATCSEMPCEMSWTHTCAPSDNIWAEQL